jgi:hypothetical protein
LSPIKQQTLNEAPSTVPTAPEEFPHLTLEDLEHVRGGDDSVVTNTFDQKIPVK